jgi:protein subunit release factor B
MTSSIPDITEKIRTQLLQVDDELSRLPETPSNQVQHIVRQHLTKFSQAAKDLLDGSTISQNNKFHSEWKNLYRQFQKATEVMRPGCVYITPFDKAKVVINIDDSDDDGASHYSTTSPAKRPFENGQDAAVKRQKFNVPTTPTRQPDIAGPSIKRENGNFTPQRPSALRKFKQSDFGPFHQDYLNIGQGALTLVDIRQSIAERGPAGIPEFDNHKIREDYALTAVNPWKFPLETFVDHTFRMLRVELLSTLRSVLQSYEQTSLYRQSKEILQKFLQRQEIEQRAISMEFYKTEAAGLFTINEAAFDLHKAEALAWLNKQRRNWRLDCYMQKQSDTVRFKDDASRENFRNKVTDAELGPDPFAKEVNIAAYIRGYYTTARLRFVDSVCANMKSRYFGKIKEELSYLLENELSLDRGDSKFSVCTQGAS